MPSRPEDDEDFGERVDFTFSEMDTNKVGAINYMQLRKWISAQMKADDEVEATGITDEMQKAATDAFAAHKRDDDLLGRDQIADLLSSLDLLKYVPEEKVQREDVTQLDYDSALGKVIKASRPLTLHFYDPPTVEVHFEEEPEHFGLTLAGASGTNCYIEHIEEDSEAEDHAGLRPGLLLKAIGGESVAAMAFDDIVAKANAGKRPMAMTFAVHKAREATSKLKLAVRLGMGSKLAQMQAPSSEHAEIPAGQTVEVNGRQWEVLSTAGEKGREVQLKLVGGTLKKRFALEKVRDLLK